MNAPETRPKPRPKCGLGLSYLFSFGSTAELSPASESRKAGYEPFEGHTCTRNPKRPTHAACRCRANIAHVRQSISCMCHTCMFFMSEVFLQALSPARNPKSPSGFGCREPMLHGLVAACSPHAFWGRAWIDPPKPCSSSHTHIAAVERIWHI